VATHDQINANQYLNQRSNSRSKIIFHFRIFSIPNFNFYKK